MTEGIVKIGSEYAFLFFNPNEGYYEYDKVTPTRGGYYLADGTTEGIMAERLRELSGKGIILEVDTEAQFNTYIDNLESELVVQEPEKSTTTSYLVWGAVATLGIFLLKGLKK